MAKIVGSGAKISNQTLKPFEVLIGQWKTTGSHPYFPNTILHGLASFEWIEGGAFLLYRSEIDDPRFPDGIEIFGSDDVAKKFYMLHFDQRGVSRKFDVSVNKNQINWHRNEPSFRQRYILTIEKNGNKLIGKGEMSRDKKPWEKDLALAYTRVK